MWKIKDPELKAKVNQFFTDEEIHEEFEKNTDLYNYFRLSTVNKKGLCVTITVEKEFVEFVPEYDPEGWNPFPAYRPPRAGNYLVYLNGRFEHQIRVSYFNTDYRSWDQYADASVLAFKELKIEPPSEDVLKFVRANRE
mgnify:CR=1 FL=1